jgi:Zn-finger nucleic acid-binding protein
MAINLECPRCKARLRVPNKKAGGYVNCPHCQGRFWVDKAAQSDASPADTVTMAAPPAATPPVAAPPPAVTPPVSPLPTLPPMRMPKPPQSVPPAPPIAPSNPKTPSLAANSAPPAAPPVVTPVSRPGRKVARFISAEAAQSTLQIAADGKLPELHLSDGGQKEKQEAKTSSMSPLALAGIMILSVGLTVLIVMMAGSPPSNNADQRTKAWSQIEADYFSDPGGRELKEYNRLLREAKQAQQAQDYKTERAIFHKLLDQLRAERDVNEKGLTGSKTRDKKLEECVTVLLNGLSKTE